MAVRNEAWVLGLSARVALLWCDELVVFMHACNVDQSGSIIDAISEETTGDVVIAQVEWDEKWDEMAHRQRMLTVARERGATHIAIIDADEVLTGNLLSPHGDVETLRGYIDRLKEESILHLPLYNLRAGLYRYHANGLWGNRVVSVAFKDSMALHWGGDTFHQREPRGKKPTFALMPIAQGEGGVMHLWGASERRLIAKHALYKITERLRWPDKDVRQIDFMYSQCVKGGLREDPAKWTFADVPESWWTLYESWMKYLDIHAVPWQEAEVRRLLEEHGRETFAGLDLFGVA